MSNNSKAVLAKASRSRSTLGPGLTGDAGGRAVRAIALGIAAAAWGTAFLMAPVRAQAPSDNFAQVQATELNLLRALVEQGVLTNDAAREMLRRAGIDPDLLKTPSVAAPRRPQAAPVAPAAIPPVPAPRSQAVPDAVRDELFEEVHQEVQAQSRAEGRANRATVPAWVQRLTFSGDVRLRYLRNDFASDNGASSVTATGAPPPQLPPLLAANVVSSWYQLPAGSFNTIFDSHDRLQIRARINVESALDDQLTGGIRLVSTAGNDATASAVSYDVELGRYARPYSLGVSLAYLQWKPTRSLQLTAGRMLNPYFRSDLIFAPEWSLDGLAVGYSPSLAVDWARGLGLFLNGGAHPLQTSQSGPFNTASGQWLLAAQSGLSWTGTDESRARIALAYYDFAGIQGKPDPANPANNTLNDASAPGFRQFGNTMFDIHYQVVNNLSTSIAPLFGYAAQYRLMNLGADYEFARFDPVRLAVQLDWVRNVGFNATQIRQRLGLAVNTLPFINGPNGAQISNVDRARTNGYLVNFRLGASALRHYGDWQMLAGIRYLQRDAVPDAFTSPDYRLGGTDNQAVFVGMNLGISAATSVAMRYIAARSIDSGPKFGVDSWFLDLTGHF
jgi:hypothetical protein